MFKEMNHMSSEPCSLFADTWFCRIGEWTEANLRQLNTTKTTEVYMPSHLHNYTATRLW